MDTSYNFGSTTTGFRPRRQEPNPLAGTPVTGHAPNDPAAPGVEAQGPQPQQDAPEVPPGNPHGIGFENFPMGLKTLMSVISCLSVASNVYLNSLRNTDQIDDQEFYDRRHNDFVNKYLFRFILFIAFVLYTSQQRPQNPPPPR